MTDSRPDELLDDYDVDAGTAALIDEMTSPFDALDGDERQNYADAEAPFEAYAEAEAAHETYDSAKTPLKTLHEVFEAAGSVGNIGANGETVGNLGGGVQ